MDKDSKTMIIKILDMLKDLDQSVELSRMIMREQDKKINMLVRDIVTLENEVKELRKEIESK